MNMEAFITTMQIFLHIKDYGLYLDQIVLI